MSNSQKGPTPYLGTLGRRYYAFWYDPQTRRTERLSLQTEDHAEALRRFASFLTEGHKSYRRSPVERRDGMTCGAALEDYFREHAQVKSADPQRTRDAINRLKEHFGEVPVDELDIPLSRAYLAARSSGTLGSRAVGRGTVRRELGVLVAALNHAVRWKRLVGQVWPVELPSEGSPSEERWLTHAELALLREKAGERCRDFIDLAYYTAGRRDSVLELTHWQVRLDQNVVHLAKPGERVTKKRRPVVPIDAAVRPLVERLVEAARKREDGLLLPGGAIRTAFEGAVERAGLNPVRPSSTDPEDINAWARKCVTPHTLRHTRATHLLQAGKPLYAVAKLLGDTVATVERVYGHHCLEWLSEAIAEEG